MFFPFYSFYLFGDVDRHQSPSIDISRRPHQSRLAFALQRNAMHDGLATAKGFAATLATGSIILEEADSSNNDDH
jgi:hypothetical protein